MLPRTLLSLAALAMLSIPAAADGSPLADLIGTNWKLTTLDGAPVDAKVTSTLVISADSIGGNGGCNTYGGNLAATPDGIDISQVWHVRAEPDPAQRWLRQVIGEISDVIAAGARALPQTAPPPGPAEPA